MLLLVAAASEQQAAMVDSMMRTRERHSHQQGRQHGAGQHEGRRPEGVKDWHIGQNVVADHAAQRQPIGQQLRQRQICRV